MFITYTPVIQYHHHFIGLYTLSREGYEDLLNTMHLSWGYHTVVSSSKRPTPRFRTVSPATIDADLQGKMSSLTQTTVKPKTRKIHHCTVVVPQI